MRRPWAAAAPAVFMLAWGGNHFTPLLHLYETLGGYAAWQANLLLGMYVFGLVPGLLIASALSDHFGRRPVLVAGLAASLAASAILAAGLASYPLLCAGRVFAGIAVGIAMSVGSSWIKELSADPWEPGAEATLGARRSSLILTLGFAIGAGVSGVIAQWAPLPSVLPYVVHIVLTILAALALLRVPETLPRGARATGAWWRDLAIPSAGQRAFWRIVVPAAPWVFGAAGIAYAVLPSILEHRLGDHATIYATLLTVVGLGVGALAQSAVPWVNRITRGRALIVGLSGVILGLVGASAGAVLDSPAYAVAVAAVLGGSYGISVVSGLVIAQSLATPRDLAGITGLFYSLTYVGFLLPTVLAAIAPEIPYAWGLAGLAVICAGCLATVATGFSRRTSS
ncbi:MFS transporter [Microbacterium indicum]|uniref:MFS transporter n=1 Tax=Microbacterium indicum TaxID=358100 RepID=UPI0004216C03|nr:MFS transporter [Microbacterium indicum]